ncbi:MAG: hypothetical protein JRN58_00075 [Nitrososphaerota archaeon]|nr:hypothetical protein [Nitrososphaerota archaeon]MDG6977469.1 hypothetical protein [Nitrososphaerota archaeon]
MAEGDGFKEWNMVQLGAALRIIYKSLGGRWYEKSGKDLLPTSPTKPAPSYDYLLQKTDLPPITALLRGGRPENYVKLVQFAGYIKTLESGTNLREKIAEYEVKERNSRITIETFESLLFELKIAAFFKRNGFEVYFIKEQKKVKTPDLRITSPDVTIFVECKKKRPQTLEERTIADVCQRIEVAILNRMMAERRNYEFKILFGARVDESCVKPIVAASNQIIASADEQATREIGSNIRIHGRRLAAIDVVQSSKDLPPLPELTTVQHLTWSAETQDSTVDLMRIHDFDVPVRNYRVIEILSSYFPSKVTSVINTVRDAATQLVLPDGAGMVAVEVALGNMAAEQDLRQILAISPELHSKLPQVGATLYCLERIINEGQTTTISTTFHGFKNPAAKIRFPGKLIDALKTTTTERGITSLVD